MTVACTYVHRGGQGKGEGRGRGRGPEGGGGEARVKGGVGTAHLVMW